MKKRRRAGKVVLGDPPDFLPQGVGSALPEHVIGEARRPRLRRLSLETGSGPAFEPALALYRRRGFVNGQEFGGSWSLRPLTPSR